jgi:hypothetical protein
LRHRASRGAVVDAPTEAGASNATGGVRHVAAHSAVRDRQVCACINVTDTAAKR